MTTDLVEWAALDATGFAWLLTGTDRKANAASVISDARIILNSIHVKAGRYRELMSRPQESCSSDSATTLG